MYFASCLSLSQIQDESSPVSGSVVRFDGSRFDQRQTAAEYQQQQRGTEFLRAGHYITPHPPTSSASCGVDSSNPQHQQHQQQSYPLSYGYDVVAGDARWMLHGHYPRTAFGPGRPGGDYPSQAAYNCGSGSGGGLVGNAVPILTRRATVEYRAQPSTTAGTAVYSMDYPPMMNFTPLPFQATAGYATGKKNY